MRTHAHVALALAALIVLSFASCSKRPAPVPTGPAGAVPAPVIRIELAGPSEIEPGESVQLTLTAFKSDNTTENVTARASWGPQNSAVLRVSSTGLLTGLARGEQVVQGHYQNRNASMRVFVLPRGTFKLSGNVRENGVGIADAQVAVLSGTGQGLSTRTAFGGSYALYGVAGNVRIQVTRDGYHNRQADLDVRSNHVEQLDITAVHARADYRGVYRLTLSAGSCRSGNATFPEEARRRVYTATVSQDGGRLTVKLSDANLVLVAGRGDQFSGFVDVGGGIRLTISDSSFYYYYYYTGSYDIIERMSSQTLVVMGTVSAQGTPSRINGPLDGAFSIGRNAAPPLNGFSHWCQSSAHEFEMERR